MDRTRGPGRPVRDHQPSAISYSRGRSQLAGDLHHLEALEDVALLEVVEAVDDDPALEAGRHLADVLADVAEAVDVALEELLPSPDHPHVGAAADETIQDVAAGDDVVVRELEGLPDLGA